MGFQPRVLDVGFPPKGAANQPLVQYRINSTDHISWIGPGWDAFAADNGWSYPSDILGTSLWSFITDNATRHIYEALLKRARDESRPVTFAFRCDAPDRKRYLQMRIQAGLARSVGFTIVAIRIETRSPVTLLDVTIPRSAEVLRMCSWCNRIAAPIWMEVEEAVTRLELFSLTVLPAISHSICEQCEKRMTALGEM